MSLAAGDFNRFVKIEKRKNQKDALNQPMEIWEEVFSAWVNVMGSTGMATIRNSEAKEGVARQISQYSFRMRYHNFTKVKNDMRVNLNGTYFSILQVNHDIANRQWTDIVCEQGGNDG